MAMATAYPTTTPRTSTSTRRQAGVYCARCGWYPTEWDCPCWTDIPEPKRSALRVSLETWYADFVRRHPQFDYGLVNPLYA